MFSNIENLKIKDITKGVTKNHVTVTCRKSSGFTFRIAGTSRYIFSDKTFDVGPGELIFLPQGSCYEIVTPSDVRSEHIAIRFSADLYDAKPALYSFKNFPEAEELINNAPDEWKFGSKYERYKCYALFYSILAYIEQLENQAYAHKKKFSVIAPAIDYLKTHLYDCDLKIETLYKLCGVSGTYFRQIFQSTYSMSPQKYILAKRLSHAKSIIVSGNFDMVSEIALSVGYKDALYFSRAFKKKYGISPSEFATAEMQSLK